MSQLFSRLELRAHRAYWSDGVLDLFCAFALLALGAAWIAEQFALGAVVPALLVPLWSLVRRRFTEPRLGAVELAEARQARSHVFLRLMLMTGVLAFGLILVFVLRGDTEPSRMSVEAMPGTIVALAALSAGAALQLSRFFVYAGAAAAGTILVLLMAVNPGWAFVTSGAAALVGGLVLMLRFRQRYSPVREEPTP